MNSKIDKMILDKINDIKTEKQKVNFLTFVGSGVSISGMLASIIFIGMLPPSAIMGSISLLAVTAMFGTTLSKVLNDRLVKIKALNNEITYLNKIRKGDIDIDSSESSIEDKKKRSNKLEKNNKEIKTKLNSKRKNAFLPRVGACAAAIASCATGGILSGVFALGGIISVALIKKYDANENKVYTDYLKSDTDFRNLKIDVELAEKLNKINKSRKQNSSNSQSSVNTNSNVNTNKNTNVNNNSNINTNSNVNNNSASSANSVFSVPDYIITGNVDVDLIMAKVEMLKCEFEKNNISLDEYESRLKQLLSELKSKTNNGGSNTYETHRTR